MVESSRELLWFCAGDGGKSRQETRAGKKKQTGEQRKIRVQRELIYVVSTQEYPCEASALERWPRKTRESRQSEGREGFHRSPSEVLEEIGWKSGSAKTWWCLDVSRVQRTKNSNRKLVQH